jgi:hypothetical protein
MKKIIVFFLICSSSAFGQEAPSVKFASHITAEGLQKDLSIIASQEMEGRETGMEGQHKAADYIESRMKSIGLNKPRALKGYQQYFSLRSDSMLNGLLEIDSLKAVVGSDFIMPAGPNKTGEYTSSTILFVGYGIRDSAYDDYAGLSVKGKTLLMFQGEPKKEGHYLLTGNDNASDWVSEGPLKKIELAASMGAAGVILVNASQDSFDKNYVKLLKRPSVTLSSPTEKKTVNYAIISHDFFKKLFPTQANRWLSMGLASEPFYATDKNEMTSAVKMVYEEKSTILNASNVLGILEGSDKKDEYVMLTAHYDHLGKKGDKIFYGADDDGSGTAAVLQMAEAFAAAKKAGNGPRRTIVFMTVSGEEKGLWGSRYYSDNPVFPMDKTTADLNTDMIGRIDTERKSSDTLNYVYVIGHDKLSSELGKLNADISKEFSGLVLDYKFDDPKDPNRIFFRSDHYNFARKGVPILFFYDGMLQADYHKPTDTVDKINWELYMKRARMIFHTAWALANSNNMISRDLPLPSLTR